VGKVLASIEQGIAASKDKQEIGNFRVLLLSFFSCVGLLGSKMAE